MQQLYPRAPWKRLAGELEEILPMQKKEEQKGEGVTIDTPNGEGPDNSPRMMRRVKRQRVKDEENQGK